MYPPFIYLQRLPLRPRNLTRCGCAPEVKGIRARWPNWNVVSNSFPAKQRVKPNVYNIQLSPIRAGVVHRKESFVLLRSEIRLMRRRIMTKRKENWDESGRVRRRMKRIETSGRFTESTPTYSPAAAAVLFLLLLLLLLTGPHSLLLSACCWHADRAGGLRVRLVSDALSSTAMLKISDCPLLLSIRRRSFPSSVWQFILRMRARP